MISNNIIDDKGNKINNNANNIMHNLDNYIPKENEEENLNSLIK